MSVTARILRYALGDVIRSRWVLATGAFFLIATDALLRFGTAGAASLLAVGSLVLLVVPLVSIVFGTVYLYQAREFTSLLLAQPVTRRQLFAGQFGGLTIPLAAALLAAIGAPFALHGLPSGVGGDTLVTILAIAVALALVFVALAFVVAMRFEDRVSGLAAAVGLWLLFSLVYDAVVLLIVMLFADYPVERPVLAMMLANPVDLARVLLLMQFDASALMGYTGAVLQRTLTGASGIALAVAALAAWIAAPGLWAWRIFQRKDL
jgi:Cu-processing system permease protein